MAENHPPINTLPDYPLDRREMYLDVIARNGGGGGGGTTDYNELSHLPQIEGVTLKGNKTLEELGAVSVDYIDGKIVQETGQETDKVMSQKAVTDELGTANEEINELKEQVTKFYEGTDEIIVETIN